MAGAFLVSGFLTGTGFFLGVSVFGVSTLGGMTESRRAIGAAVVVSVLMASAWWAVSTEILVTDESAVMTSVSPEPQDTKARQQMNRIICVVCFFNAYCNK